MTFVYTSQQNLKSTKFKFGLIQTFLNNIYRYPRGITKTLEYSSFHLSKIMAFKTFNLKIVKLCLKHFKYSNVYNV